MTMFLPKVRINKRSYNQIKDFQKAQSSILVNFVMIKSWGLHHFGKPDFVPVLKADVPRPL